MSFWKPIFAVWCVVLLVAPGQSQDWAKQQLEASPRHGEWVQIGDGSRKLDAFVVYPEVADKATSVLVIHEIFGLTDWVRSVADQLAAEGYIAIAPDLLSGMGPQGGNTSSFDGETVRRAIMQLPPDQVTADLKAASQYVISLPASNGRLAVAGFCWGGTQTFRFATNSDAVQAAMPFYGSAPTELSQLKQIDCPVYGFYAENDARINATLDQTKQLMAEAGKTFEPVTYPGAGHGFMRAGAAPDASPANKAAREAGWKRLLGILSQLEKQ